MKTFHSVILTLVALATICLGGERAWMTDWPAAKARAKAENKMILINLTGSDWCTWCIKIEKEVFSQKEFQDFAQKHLILFEADFPKKPQNVERQSAALKTQNAALEKQYLNKGYPTVWILDADGNKRSDDLGELKGGTAAYVAKIQEILAAPRNTAAP